MICHRYHYACRYHRRFSQKPSWIELNFHFKINDVFRQKKNSTCDVFVRLSACLSVTEWKYLVILLRNSTHVWLFPYPFAIFFCMHSIVMALELGIVFVKLQEVNWHFLFPAHVFHSDLFLVYNLQLTMFWNCSRKLNPLFVTPI